MPKKCKPRIGLLGLMFKDYDAWPDLKPRREHFARKLIEQLSAAADVDYPGICDTQAQVADAVARFEGEKVDLLVVVFLTYCPSFVPFPSLQRTSLPILLFNTQELWEITPSIEYDDLLDNHGMHGVQDLANVLLRAGRSFHILTGHYTDKATLEEFGGWCRAAAAVSFLRQARIALFGYPMKDMGDIAIDETALRTQLGVTIEHIPLRRVAEAAAQAPAEDIARQMETDRQNFLMDATISQEEHAASSRLEWAIRTILQEDNFDGWAAHFAAFAEDGRIQTLPFLAACKLLAEGYAFGGEGDVVSATVVALVNYLMDMATFTEMFTMDFAHECILMSHMGEINYRMARKGEPVRMVRRFFPMVNLIPPVTLCCTLKPGPATLVNLTTGVHGRLKLIAAEGLVADFPSAPILPVPHYRFQPSGSLSQFLTRFSEEGGSHHQALAYGRGTAVIEKVARLLNLEYARV